MRRVVAITMVGVLAGVVPASVGLASDDIQIHPKCQKLPTELLGPFVKLADGSVLCLTGDKVMVSTDDGNSWQSRPLFGDKNKDKFAVWGGPILRTRNGVIIAAFHNRVEFALKWDQSKGGPQPGCRLPVYVVRSLDEGKTWEDPQLVQDGYCGALNALIQLRGGRVVLGSQLAVRDPGRHVTLSYVSDDDGATWKKSNILDLGKYGGYGDHGGGIEATIVELTDGRVWMLLRTYRGCFSESFSNDGGLTWEKSRPSKIAASGSPGKLLRLTSGRIILAWNRFIDPVKRTGRREQLSIAFSEDDGKTWSEPVVVGYDPLKPGNKQSQHRLSYPNLYEHRPGEVWVTTGQGKLRIKLHESDFVK